MLNAFFLVSVLARPAVVCRGGAGLLRQNWCRRLFVTLAIILTIQPATAVSKVGKNSANAPAFGSSVGDKEQPETLTGLQPVPVPAPLAQAAQSLPDWAFLLGKNLYQRWSEAQKATDSGAAVGLIDDAYPGEQVRSQALYWLRQAAKAGHGEAVWLLAQDAAQHKQDAQVLAWYQQAAAAHVAPAALALGNVFLYGLLGQTRDCKKAEMYFSQAEKLGNAHAYNNHAWMLATARDPQCRNPEKAMRLWSELDWDTVRGQPVMMAAFWDTLAAIHAALRDFGSAVDAQRKAIALMSKHQAPDDEMLADMQRRLRAYESGSPWFKSEFMAAGRNKKGQAGQQDKR